MNQEQRQAYEWAKSQNYQSVAARYAKVLAGLVDEMTPPNEPLTCEGCACESYPRDCYPCNTCNRNDETLSDQYRPPAGEEDT